MTSPSPSPHSSEPTRKSSDEEPSGRVRSLFTIHLVFSVGLIGAALVLVGLGVAGVRGADPQTIYPAAHLIDAYVLAPMGVLALTTGIIQAIATGRGLFRHRWVTIKLTVTTVTVVVVIFVLEPRLAASADAALAGEAFTTAERLPLAIAPALAAVLLVMNATLGVYKPSRKRSSRRNEQ